MHGLALFGPISSILQYLCQFCILPPAYEPSQKTFTSWDDLLATQSRSGQPFGSIPRFVQFASHHQTAALAYTGQVDFLPNLLQGGSSAGPIRKSPVGQVVRWLAFYPGLSAPAPRHALDTVYQHDDLSWVVELQSHIRILQTELRQQLPHLPAEAWQSLRTKKGREWSDDTGWAHLAFIDNFERIEANGEYFPATMDVLEQVVGTSRIGPRLVAIARQRAHSGIPKHYDYMNYMLTLHTPLLGPDNEGGAGMVVNGSKRDWNVGDPIVMDTTFAHETYNDCDKDVYLLLVDFWHPDLSMDEIDALRTFLAQNSGV